MDSASLIVPTSSVRDLNLSAVLCKLASVRFYKLTTVESFSVMEFGMQNLSLKQEKRGKL